MINAGQQLRHLREHLGYTIRDVEAASLRIAAKHKNDDFAIPLSRLYDIETKGVIPSIYRLYALSVIYRRDIRELMEWFGIDLTQAAVDMHLAEPPRSHTTEGFALDSLAEIPVKLDPSFDAKKTTNLGRMVQQWGIVPFAQLGALAPEKFAYGYIGSEDFTMYPLLLPGSFVQIDETRNRVQEGMWRSELERPIYFIETRNGFVCSWCSLQNEEIVLQPHPLSPVSPRTLKYRTEAEVLGQVVGIAMRIGDWTTAASRPQARSSRQQLN